MGRCYRRLFYMPPGSNQATQKDKGGNIIFPLRCRAKQSRASFVSSHFWWCFILLFLNEGRLLIFENLRVHARVCVHSETRFSNVKKRKINEEKSKCHFSRHTRTETPMQSRRRCVLASLIIRYFLPSHCHRTLKWRNTLKESLLNLTTPDCPMSENKCQVFSHVLWH